MWAKVNSLLDKEFLIFDKIFFVAMCSKAFAKFIFLQKIKFLKIDSIKN